MRNTGPRAGVAVPQLYLTGPGESVPRLVGWKRLALGPGESAHVTITADQRTVARWRGGRWAVSPGGYTLTVGADATHPVATGRVEIPGRG